MAGMKNIGPASEQQDQDSYLFSVGVMHDKILADCKIKILFSCMSARTFRVQNKNSKIQTQVLTRLNDAPAANLPLQLDAALSTN